MEDNRYSVASKKYSGIWKSLRDGDFEEEEVWDVLKNRPDYSEVDNPKDKEMKDSSSLASPSSTTSARVIPKSSNNNNSSSNASSSHEANFLQQSAPLNIPDWSKIHRKSSNRNKASSKNNVPRFGDSVDDEDDGDGAVNHIGGDSDEDEDDEENDSKLPPHELIAERLARSQISSFSVLEGAGRTLKGRDLSKVRNAVLTKTGFLE